MQNTSETKLRWATRADSSELKQLLLANTLPVEDVELRFGAFVLAIFDGNIIGSVGLERSGDSALLRSFCVAEAHRSRGVGATLIAAIESVAYTEGVRTLYLLTTTAVSYFERHGFVPVSRTAAPVGITASAEFQSLCPSTAVCMYKRLAATAYFRPKALLPLVPDIPGARMWAVKLEASMLTYFEVDAGVRFETHQHEGEQITTVVEGELFFETPLGTVCVRPGEVIAIPAGVPHAVFTGEQAARAFDAWSSPFPRPAVSERDPCDSSQSADRSRRA